MAASQSGAGFGQRAILAWIAVVAWIAVIFSLSSEGFAAPETEGFFGPLLRWLIPGLSDGALAAIHFGIRKSAHFGEYAVLALLTYRALGVGGVASRSLQLGFAVALCFAVASADETRQAFSATRGGSLADVALDLSGAVVALALALRWRRLGVVSRWLPAAPTRGEA